MDAAAGLGEHGHVRVVDLEAVGTHAGVQVGGRRRRQYPVVAEGEGLGGSSRFTVTDSNTEDVVQLELR